MKPGGETLPGLFFDQVVTTPAVSVLFSMKGVCNRMSKEAGKREIIYQMTMRTAWKMVQKEVLSREEYLDFETKMREKYRPVIGGLFSDIDLLSCG